MPGERSWITSVKGLLLVKGEDASSGGANDCQRCDSVPTSFGELRMCLRQAVQRCLQDEAVDGTMFALCRPADDLVFFGAYPYAQGFRTVVETPM